MLGKPPQDKTFNRLTKGRLEGSELPKKNRPFSSENKYGNRNRMRGTVPQQYVSPFGVRDEVDSGK